MRSAPDNKAIDQEPSPSNVKPASFGKNAFWNSVGSLMYQGCLWLTTVLVVLLSNGYADSGVLALAMAIGNMYDPIATYSMRVFQASDTAGAHPQSRYVGFRIVTMAIGLAIIIPYSAVVAQDPTAFASIAAFILFKANEAFCDVLYGIDQHHERMDYIGISQLIRSFGVLGGFALGIWLTGSLTVAILAMFGYCVVVTCVYDIPHARRLDSIRPAIRASLAWELLKTCFPIALATLLLSMIVSIARQSFSFLSGVEALGIYAAVATPAVLVQALARYLYSPVLVPLAQKWTNGDVDGFTTLLRKTLLIMTGVTIPAVIALSFAGSPALALVYGDSIVGYTYLFPCVLASVSVIAFVWLLTDVLVVIRDLRGVLIANASALATCLATMVPLETAFGMNGINFTIIAAMLVGVAVAALRLVLHVRRGRPSGQQL